MFDNQVATYPSELMSKRMTLREKLEQSKKRIEEELVNVNHALEMLEKNPAFEETHNALVKVGY